VYAFKLTKMTPHENCTIDGKTDLQLIKEAKNSEDPKCLEILAAHPNALVRGAAAGNPHITQTIFDKLSKDETKHVRIKLEKNPEYNELSKVVNIADRFKDRLKNSGTTE